MLNFETYELFLLFSIIFRCSNPIPEPFSQQWQGHLTGAFSH